MFSWSKSPSKLPDVIDFQGRLRALAQMDSPNAELRINSKGAWQVDFSWTYKQIKGYSYIQFDSKESFDLVDIAFEAAIEAARANNYKEAHHADLLFPALRGLSGHLFHRFGTPESPAAKAGVLPPGAADVIRKRFQRIERMVVRYQKRKNAALVFPKTFSQRAFIPEEDVRGGGMCFGITTYWCLRFVTSRKTSYGQSKHKDRPDPPSIEDRLAKKAPFIYHLQKQQVRMERLAPADHIHIRDLVGTSGVQQLSQSMQQDLHLLYAHGPVSSSSNKYSDVQSYINRQVAKFGSAKITNLRMQRTSIPGSILYSFSPNDKRLKSVVERIFNVMMGARCGAYIIGMNFASSFSFEGNKHRAPYFIRDVASGHAIGVISAGNGHWSLIDPNYGEIDRKTLSEIKEAVRNIIAVYVAYCHVNAVTVLEIST